MQNLPIFFHKESDFLLLNTHKKQAAINQIIISENKFLGEINCIFCSDDYLLQINQQYLAHNTYTDIITFDYVENNLISGDLFISTDRVRENAIKFEVSFQTELNRVLAHGILHLIGYNDKTVEEARTIRAKEDFYLPLFSEK